jgi:hypothetical protein
LAFASRRHLAATLREHLTAQRTTIGPTCLNRTTGWPVATSQIIADLDALGRLPHRRLTVLRAISAGPKPAIERGGIANVRTFPISRAECLPHPIARGFNFFGLLDQVRIVRASDGLENSDPHAYGTKYIGSLVNKGV